MPPLSHWPDRSQPFEYEKSEVIQWIRKLLRKRDPIEDAVYVFQFSSHLNAIVFDRETKLWQGNVTWADTSKRTARQRRNDRLREAKLLKAGLL